MLIFFSIPVFWKHNCILNVRLGGKTDQQNNIMHKAYSSDILLGLALERNSIFRNIHIKANFDLIFRGTVMPNIVGLILVDGSDLHK